MYKKIILTLIQCVTIYPHYEEKPFTHFNAEYWPWFNSTTQTGTLNPSVQEIADLFSSAKDFLWGVATSAHQVEGNCTNNNWSLFEQQKDAIYQNQQSGIACGHWHRIDEDIELMKELGINAYRFSVEWSKIEPAEGVFDELALKHYEEVCEKLCAANIKPIITLHHYTNPIWFEQKGAFEKEENIPDFINFCTTVCNRFERMSPLWVTFNSPSGYALQGYYRGVYPPGKKDMNLAMVVTQNMLNAHVQVYTTLKRMHPNSCIGIIHHYYPLKMYSWKRPWDKIGCAIGNNITNNATLNFFKNGTFSLYVPYKVAVKYVNPLAPQSLDFFGISYYSHGHLKNFKPTHTEPAELGTDKDTFVIHPEGLFHAVKLTAETLGNTMPIYIMENGIADAADTKRELFLQRYLYALGQASRLYNVKGYIYWSLMDNFEWNEGYRTCFGLYSVDWHTRTRAKRKSADYFAHIIRTYTVKYSS